MTDVVNQIFRFILKLVLGLSAALFAFSLLILTLLVLALGLLKSFITGRKPSPMLFGRFQQFSPQGVWPASRPREATAVDGTVVDVQAREIREDKRLS